ncbi:MAG: antitoxin YezG family protein [Saccharofermentans sp.]|nr:antitoxin YezG family protein [Saccharofermentans sp.]
MIKEFVYQGILDELSAFLTDGWEELVVYLEYGDSSYTFEFYVKVNGNYIKCYDLPGVSDDDLAKSFSNIDEMISSERNHETDPLWTNMTMVVTNSGVMHADFDYTDLTQGAYQYMLDWKKKYLK